MLFFFFSSRRRHTRLTCDWSSDVCSSDLTVGLLPAGEQWNETVTFCPCCGEDGEPPSMPQVGACWARVGVMVVETSKDFVKSSFFRNTVSSLVSLLALKPESLTT